MGATRGSSNQVHDPADGGKVVRNVTKGWTNAYEYLVAEAFAGKRDLSWSPSGDLIAAFNARGGRVAYGTDDNYIWATPGFSTVRELQLGRETGMKTLEVMVPSSMRFTTRSDSVSSPTTSGFMFR